MYGIAKDISFLHDKDKKLIGYTTFVPSQLNVVDVGTVDVTENR